MEGLATSKEVAAYLKVHPQSMDRWASHGNGPRYTKIGGVRRYDWRDVRAWVDENKSGGGPDYRCSKCRKPVRSDGYLVVDLNEAVRVQRAHKEFDQRPDSWKPIDINALMDLPGEAPWGTFHAACDDTSSRNGYYMEIERVSSWPTLIRFIAHVAEKDWFHYTDLTQFLYRVTGE